MLKCKAGVFKFLQIEEHKNKDIICLQIKTLCNNLTILIVTV